jgi:uncharacterized protein (DUF2345 family)
VRCPCGKNRVIAGEGVGCFIHVTSDTASAGVTQSPGEVAQAAFYDEQFTLLDNARHPLANVRYRIIACGEREITGTTDAEGKTVRIRTDTLSRLRLYIQE